ncbi:MAG: type II toxin-antitoxin system HicA family toxin [Halobacteriota archaeon]
MKRRKLLRHLREHGCVFLREGKRHTVYCNPANRKVSTVPRHTDIDDVLAEKICRDLEIPPPS